MGNFFFAETMINYDSPDSHTITSRYLRWSNIDFWSYENFQVYLHDYYWIQTSRNDIHLFFSNHTDSNKCNFGSFRGNKLNKFTHTYNAIKQVWAKFQLISRNFKWVTMLWIAKSHFFFAAGNQTRLQITIKLAISDQCGWKFIPECKTARIIARYVFFCITLHILGGF